MAGVVIAGTIEKGQLDDVWCPECWFWRHVSRPCSCFEDPSLRSVRQAAVTRVPVAVGRLYEDGCGQMVVVTALVTKEGKTYAYCLSQGGEISVPVERFQPPYYHLVKRQW